MDSPRKKQARHCAGNSVQTWYEKESKVMNHKSPFSVLLFWVAILAFSVPTAAAHGAEKVKIGYPAFDCCGRRLWQEAWLRPRSCLRRQNEPRSAVGRRWGPVHGANRIWNRPDLRARQERPRHYRVVCQYDGLFRLFETA